MKGRKKEVSRMKETVFSLRTYAQNDKLLLLRVPEGKKKGNK